VKRMITGILAIAALGAGVARGEQPLRPKSIQESVVISQPVITEADGYLGVKLYQANSLLSRTGEPVLPVVSRVFVLPLGSKVDRVDVAFSQAREIKLSGELLPGPQPTPKTGGRVPKERAKDSAIYGSAEAYPANTFNYRVGTGIEGDRRVVFLTVDCYPLRYSPALNALHYSDRLNISVTYEEPVVPATFPDAYDMVIIAPSTFSEELQPLIDHKNLEGVQTALKTTEEIYTEYMGRDDPEKIKYFIKDAIETWGVEYVLLVGGAAQLPGRYTHIYFDYDYQDYWVFLSDLYYADVYDDTLGFSSWDTNDNDLFAEYNWYGATDELDLYPDVYLGRLACVSESQVTICVNKIMAYESTGAYSQEWFTNLVLLGGDSLPGDEEQVDEGEYVNQHVADTLDQFTPIRVWASNGLLNNAANISAAINAGAGFVFFNGHGNTTIWATHPHESSQWIPPGNYTNSHINALTNGGKLPIVISDACYHCQYDVAPYCFGWTFLTNPNGGAIAFLGGTNIDVSYGGEAIITKGIERLCVIMSGNYQNGDAALGQLWGHGVSSYISPVMDEIDYITLEEFQPFGDPSLRIAGDSQRPNKPATPQGQSEGMTGEEYLYTSSTIDPDGDSLYYLFDWDDETNSGWMGPFASGDTSAAAHWWGTAGGYQVRVMARDDNGVFSVWSDPLEVDICERRGDVTGDGGVDIGDAIYLLNYLYKNGPAPSPLMVGDCNCSGGLELGDAVFLLNYLFKGGLFPCC
jgi:hypothetical protein